MSDANLTIPGLVFIGAEAAGMHAAVIHLGPAVGWTIPRGVHTWSRELSVVMKQDVTPELRRELGLVLPEQQGDAEVVPRAYRAAQACSIVVVDERLADKLVAKGLRIHTVGFDRVSSGFFYFAAGAGRPPKRVQGELVEIITPTLQTGAREEIDARLDGLIDRLVTELSEGALSEAQLELAEALPALGPKSDAAANKLQTLEGWLILQATRSEKREPDARQMVEALRGAAGREPDVVAVAPFGNARRVDQPELEVEIMEGDSGKRGRLTLPARTRWLLAAGEATPAQVVAPRVAPAAKADDSVAAAARGAADRTAAQQAADQRAEAERAAAKKAASERATAERAATERAAAERASAERASAERAALERAEAERFAEKQAAVERADAERVAKQLASAERAAAEDAARERAQTERAATERKEAEKVAERAAAGAAPAVRTGTKPSAKGPKSASGAQPNKEPFPYGLILVMLVLGAMAGALLQYCHQ